jgi:hypothetical protein
MIAQVGKEIVHKTKQIASPGAHWKQDAELKTVLVVTAIGIFFTGVFVTMMYYWLTSRKSQVWVIQEHQYPAPAPRWLRVIRYYLHTLIWGDELVVPT